MPFALQVVEKAAEVVPRELDFGVVPLGQMQTFPLYFSERGGRQVKHVDVYLPLNRSTNSPFDFDFVGLRDIRVDKADETNYANALGSSKNQKQVLTAPNYKLLGNVLVKPSKKGKFSGHLYVRYLDNDTI